MFSLFQRRAAASPDAPTCVTQSETGLVRAANEDHVLVLAEAGVYCVADGMGGGAEGARASEMVCREVRHLVAVAEPNHEARVRAIRHGLVAANEAIFAYAAERGFRQMGSTAAVLVMDAPRGRATVLHVGDSRVYRLRGGLAEPLTRDHSIGFELSDFAGADAALYRDRANPLSHVLTRAIGVKEGVAVECRETDVRAGDRFVLCTDGVHDVISDARLAVYAGGRDLAAARTRLTEAIERAGAPDNFSFILVRA